MGRIRPNSFERDLVRLKNNDPDAVKQSIREQMGYAKANFRVYQVMLLVYFFNVLGLNEKDLFLRNSTEIPIIGLPVDYFWFYMIMPAVVLAVYIIFFLNLRLLNHYFVASADGKERPRKVLLNSGWFIVFPFLQRLAHAEQPRQTATYEKRRNIWQQVLITAMKLMQGKWSWNSAMLRLRAYRRYRRKNRLQFYERRIVVSAMMWVLLPITLVMSCRLVAPLHDDRIFYPTLISALVSLFLVIYFRIRYYESLEEGYSKYFNWSNGVSFLLLLATLVTWIGYNAAKEGAPKPWRNFAYLDLRNVDFSTANGGENELPSVTIEAQNFNGGTLSSVYFDRAVVEDTRFTHAKLDKIGFSACRLMDVDFSRSSLQDVKFDEADLENVQMRRCNLENVDFSGSICNVRFGKSKLISCNFQNSDILNLDFLGDTLVECDFRNLKYDLLIDEVEAVFGNVARFENCLLQKDIDEILRVQYPSKFRNNGERY